MGVLQQTSGALASEGDLLRAYSCIRHQCLLAGLSCCDAEDVAQDVFLWILRSRPLLQPLGAQWLETVTRNFVRRSRRARSVRVARESEAAGAILHTTDSAKAVETTLSLDRIEQRLPAVEAKLLRLVRQGDTFVEAVASLGIPRGSRNFFRKRLLTHLGQRLGAQTETRANGDVGDRAPVSGFSKAPRHQGFIPSTRAGCVDSPKKSPKQKNY